MKGIMVVVSFCILLGFNSCSRGYISLPQVQTQCKEYSNIVGALIEYMIEHSLINLSVKDSSGCIRVYPEISVNQKAGYYNMWNNEMKWLRGEISHSFLQKHMSGLALDSTSLRSSLFLSCEVAELEGFNDNCVDIALSLDDTMDRLWISPAINTRVDGLYHLAVNLDRKWDPVNYLFSFRKEVGFPVVFVDHYYSDMMPNSRGLHPDIEDLIKGE